MRKILYISFIVTALILLPYALLQSTKNMKMHSDILAQVDRAVTEEFNFTDIIATHEEQTMGSERTNQVFGISVSIKKEGQKIPNRTLRECFLKGERKYLCIDIYFDESQITSAELFWSDEGKKAAEMWIKLMKEKISEIEVSSARANF